MSDFESSDTQPFEYYKSKCEDNYFMVDINDKDLANRLRKVWGEFGPFVLTGYFALAFQGVVYNFFNYEIKVLRSSSKTRRLETLPEMFEASWVSPSEWRFYGCMYEGDKFPCENTYGVLKSVVRVANYDKIVRSAFRKGLITKNQMGDLL